MSKITYLGIGSLPFKDPNLAFELVKDLKIPFIANLPKLNANEWMMNWFTNKGVCVEDYFLMWPLFKKYKRWQTLKWQCPALVTQKKFAPNTWNKTQGMLKQNELILKLTDELLKYSQELILFLDAPGFNSENSDEEELLNLQIDFLTARGMTLGVHNCAHDQKSIDVNFRSFDRSLGVPDLGSSIPVWGLGLLETPQVDMEYFSSPCGLGMESEDMAIKHLKMVQHLMA